MLKLPRPGSLGESTSTPPPASCSPLSGKSSSKTITDSFPVGSGVGSDGMMTGAKAALEVAHPAISGLQAEGISAPLMVWPTLGQLVVDVGVQPFPTFPVLNGLAASPGS